MAEAEDVIVDAARHVATRVLSLWQRHAADDAGPTTAATLAGLEPRLALLIEAWTGERIAIHAASPPAPATLLQRLLGRDDRPRPRCGVPGTDGTAVFLPARIEDTDAQAALDFYRVTALHQAGRCLRGTAAHYPHDAPAAVQDRFLISEFLAIDRWMVRTMPGFRRALAAVRAASRAALASDESNETGRRVLALYRAALDESSGRRAADIPHAASPAQSLDWARSQAEILPAQKRFTGLRADWSLGEILRGEAAATPMAPRTAPAEGDGSVSRTARMKRRPRVRDSPPDEDDAQAGLWMVQSSPPSEHVEDPMGLQRPVDRQSEPDLDGAAESLADLPRARLVTAPGTPKEILLADDDPLPRAVGRGAGVTGTADEGAIVYPEWDWRAGHYIDRAVRIRHATPTMGPLEWVERTLSRHRATHQHVRRRFEALRARRSVARQQSDGDEVDLHAFVDAFADRRARQPREDRIYLAHRPARLDLTLLILIDASGSTDGWISGGRRVIDVEKEALLAVTTAMDALSLDSAIYGFSGHGPTHVSLRALKRFEERCTRDVQRRIGALEPEAFTRIGAAVRHGSALLARRPAARRLLLMLSDGKPNDCDRYEGRYGVEDTRQSLAEARLLGITPYCVTVDRTAGRHLPHVFGARSFSIVREPVQLAAALVEWLRNAALAAR
jgi:nitric oxide reductase NorD protein